MDQLLANIWQYRSILIAILIISLLISVWGIVKRNALLILICIILFGAGSTTLISAWNTLNNSAHNIATTAGDIAEENGIYNREKTEDFKGKTKQFFNDLMTKQ